MWAGVGYFLPLDQLGPNENPSRLGTGKIVSLEGVLVKKNRMPWGIAKLLLSSSSCWMHEAIFLCS